MTALDEDGPEGGGRKADTFVRQPGTQVDGATLPLPTGPTPVSRSAPRRAQAGIVALALAGVSVPLGLQLWGLLPASYTFKGGKLVVNPWAAPFHPVPTLTILWVATGVILVLATAVLGRTVDALASAERRQFAQGWPLRQIFPASARGAESPRETP